ncbi:hypothetical protein [Ornithinibacillus contaminans]|uniref:hypothetical protein n=1 Tax=Ornithinibacillus contaminans TaxID=694055 RepID=UPI00064DB9B9|nr:hypothetical protein [Ornithinibacillus contaminans]
MKNYFPTNMERRFKANVSPIGTTQLHLRNPYIIAWWSAAFPGFGHLLLSKYLRGYALFIWEIVVNSMAHINLSIIYSFTGKLDMAKEVLEPRWMLMYLPVYFFAIWDSYRTTVDMNKVFILAEREDAKFPSFNITATEINYLDKRRPLMAVVWSLFTPGLGQLYIHRVLTGVFTMIFVIIFIYKSQVLVAIYYLFIGELALSTQVLDPHWFLFLPSHIGFGIYDSYINTVENNKLFESEQRKFLVEQYQHYQVRIRSR